MLLADSLNERKYKFAWIEVIVILYSFWLESLHRYGTLFISFTFWEKNQWRPKHLISCTYKRGFVKKLSRSFFIFHSLFLVALIYIHIYMSMCARVYIYIYIYILKGLNVFCVCEYIYLYVRCVCVSIYIYIYIVQLNGDTNSVKPS